MSAALPDLSAGLCFATITTRAEALRLEPLIFPNDDGSPQVQHANARTAVEMCAGCPVRPECLDYALRTDSVGTWGGTSTRQRLNLTRRQRRNVRQEQYK